MRQINKKNYIILAILIVVTITVTLLSASIYKSSTKEVSEIYKYLNKITPEEFEGYLVENPDVIVYISDRYDLTRANFEKQLSKKIDNLSLKNRVVYIDKSEINQDFTTSLKNNHNTNIELENTPVIISIIDKEVISTTYINEYSNVNTVLDYSKFE